MGKKSVALVVLFSFILQLTACFYASGEEFYRLPQMPKDYEKLQTEIDKILAEGAEYAPPTAGQNRSAIQKIDLDGDSIFEGIAFFRVNNEDRPLKIYVFKLTENGEAYEIMSKISIEGEVFDSIIYSDLNNSGSRQIIAGCKVGAGSLRAVSVFNAHDDGAPPLMSTNCTAFTVYDIDGDEERELLVANVDNSEDGIVEVYKFIDKTMERIAAASVSKGMENIKRLKTGYLLSMIPALYIAGIYEKTSLVTDIFAFRDGEFQNITLNSYTGISEETLRNHEIYATNIDEDNVLDLPQPVRIPNDQSRAGEELWIYNWRSYGIDGKARQILSTYHDFDEGWYLVLPEEWLGKITVWHEEYYQGERTTVFARWHGSSKRSEPFLKIYSLTGDNKEERSRISGRFILKTGAYTEYSAELIKNGLGDEFNPGADTIKDSFKYIQSEWVSGEMYN